MRSIVATSKKTVTIAPRNGAVKAGAMMSATSKADQPAVKEIIEKAGLTITETADLAKISRATVSRMVNGRKVSAANVSKVVNAVEIRSKQNASGLEAANVLKPTFDDVRPGAMAAEHLQQAAIAEAQDLLTYVKELRDRAFRRDPKINQVDLSSLRNVCTEIYDHLQRIQQELKSA